MLPPSVSDLDSPKFGSVFRAVLAAPTSLLKLLLSLFGAFFDSLAGKLVVFKSRQPGLNRSDFCCGKQIKQHLGAG